MKTVNEQINEVLRLAGVKPLYEMQLDEGVGDFLKNAIGKVFNSFSKKSANEVLPNNVINNVKQINNKKFTSLIKASALVSLALSAAILAGCETVKQCSQLNTNTQDNTNVQSSASLKTNVNTNTQDNTNVQSNPTSKENKLANINIKRKPKNIKVESVDVENVYFDNLEKSGEQHGECSQMGIYIPETKTTIDLSKLDLTNVETSNFVNNLDEFNFVTVTKCLLRDTLYKFYIHCYGDKFKEIILDNGYSYIKLNASQKTDLVKGLTQIVKAPSLDSKGNPLPEEEFAKLVGVVAEATAYINYQSCDATYDQILNSKNFIYTIDDEVQRPNINKNVKYDTHLYPEYYMTNAQVAAKNKKK